MKSFKQFSATLLMLLIATASAQAFSLPIGDDEVADTINYNVYQGKVVDADNSSPLPFATIEINGLNLATVSNIDGEFTLKVPKDENPSSIKVSYVGYKNATASIDDLKEKRLHTIKLQPTSVILQEVTIRSEDALGIVESVLYNVRHNYSRNDVMMTAFYRETTKKRRNYVSISEAVVDIFKAGYDNNLRYDQVRLLQGRKSADVEKMDTIMFKVQGGPVTALMLDIVKNPTLLLSQDYKEIYDFTLTSVISMNDRLHYVISFNQKPHVTSPYYKGKFYVDIDKLALTEAEFELNMENQFEVEEMFIRKKPIGMKVSPQRAAYRAKYTIEDDNSWHFSYARGEVKFDVNWDKKLFKTSYSTMSEIAITDRLNTDVEKIPMKERFKRSHVMEELVYVFFDQDFWGGYNVIEPDQSIENAIKRLNKKFMKNAEEVNP